MNAWKYLRSCALVLALVGSGCAAGEDSPTRDLPPGSGGRGGSGGTAGETGGSGGTAGESGQGGMSSGGESGQGGMNTGGDSGQGGMEMRVFDAGSEPDRNDVTAGELCDRLSTIQCAGEAYCCDNPGRDFAACKAEMQDGCEDNLYLDDLASSDKTGFDPAHARAAYDEIERLASECDPSVAMFGASVQGLRGLFKGTVASGGSCSTINVTRRDEVAKALASCSDPAANACLPGSALFWNCAARAGAGSRCFTDVNCHDGLFCDNPTFDLAGSTCMNRKELGAPCGLPNECASLFCKGGQCVEANAQNAYCLAQ